MSLDIEKLEWLARAALEQHANWIASGGSWPQPNARLLEMQAAANPAVVLELIAEVERHQSLYDHMKLMREAYGYESWTEVLAVAEQLKAENEALRKNATRYEWLRDERTRPGCLSSDPDKARWLNEYLMCGDQLDAAIDEQLAKVKQS